MQNRVQHIGVDHARGPHIGRAHGAAMRHDPIDIGHRQALHFSTPADAIDVSARFAPLAIRASFAAAARRVWIESIAPLAAPDVLVYAGATAAGADGRLPSDARLLGTLPQSGRRAFQLAAGESFVVLYSLGHQVVIAGASLAERAR